MVTQAVIMAAGSNTRFWPLGIGRHKCMYEILGKPILYHVLIELKKLKITDIVIVTRPHDTFIKSYFGSGKKFGLKMNYAIQKIPGCTGNAVWSAQRYLKEDFILLNATKLNCSEIIKPMLAMHKRKKSNIVFSSQKTSTPWVYGILDIKGDKVCGIVEKPKKGKEPGNDKVVGVYLLPKRIIDYIAETPIMEDTLEVAIDKLIKKEGNVHVVKIGKIHEMTLKYPWHLFDINIEMMKGMKKRIDRRANIHKTAIIEGNVIIEKGVKVMPYASIKGPCYIGENTILGDHALVRDHTYIGKNCVVGHSTELKHCIVYDDVKFHKNFFGESIIDRHCRFGAGTTTGNRRLDRKSIKTDVKGELVDTGRTFFGTICGERAKTGINTNIMPGMKIGNNSIVGPGTNLMEDVKDNLYYYSKHKAYKKKRV